jgi:hypothetical protein
MRTPRLADSCDFVSVLLSLFLAYPLPTGCSWLGRWRRANGSCLPTWPNRDARIPDEAEDHVLCCSRLHAMAP